MGSFWHIFFSIVFINQILNVMPEKERITNPTMGSNEVGTETREPASTGVSAGTNTQLEKTALGGKKHKKHKGVDNVETEKGVVEKINREDPAGSGK